MAEPQKRLRRKIKKKTFFEKNASVIVGVFVALFLLQSVRGCVNTSSLERDLGNQNAYYDSLLLDKDTVIFLKNGLLDTRDSTIVVKDDFIQYLEYELKIAGVKVDAAEKRARAVQSTAEAVRSNTTTTIRIEADTTRNRVTQVPDSLKNEK